MRRLNEQTVQVDVVCISPIAPYSPCFLTRNSKYPDINPIPLFWVHIYIGRLKSLLPLATPQFRHHHAFGWDVFLSGDVVNKPLFDVSMEITTTNHLHLRHKAYAIQLGRVEAD